MCEATTANDAMVTGNNNYGSISLLAGVPSVASQQHRYMQQLITDVFDVRMRLRQHFYKYETFSDRLESNDGLL